MFQLHDSVHVRTFLDCMTRNPNASTISEADRTSEWSLDRDIQIVGKCNQPTLQPDVALEDINVLESCRTCIPS